MRLRLVALEAVTLTLVSFLVLSMTTTEAITLCLLYVSVLVVTRSLFPQRVEKVEMRSAEMESWVTEMLGDETTARPLLPGAARERWYAVARDLRPGVYATWGECAQQVMGVKGAVHKSFTTRKQAEAFFSAQAIGLEAGDIRLRFLGPGDFCNIGTWFWLRLL